MDEADFYLEDLKSKFDKINPKEYYLVYSGGKDSFLLYWFIKNYLKNNDIEITERCDKKKIFPYRSSDMETCFDDVGNFYPLHDLETELENEIINKYGVYRE